MTRIHAAIIGAFIFIMTHPTVALAQNFRRVLRRRPGRGNGDGFGQPFSVPEIDASTGALALAALGAALVLAWEINRRRKTA